MLISLKDHIICVLKSYWNQHSRLHQWNSALKICRKKKQNENGVTMYDYVLNFNWSV